MNEERTAEIASGLASTTARIRDAVTVAGRTDTVDLVVVTKTFPPSDLAILASLGVADVAENRDQEARGKREALAGGAAIRWHMIGRVQRNKAASVAGWADTVDSLDRIEIVAPLGTAALALGRRIEVLVQVALDPVEREGRGGIDPSRVLDLAEAIGAQPALVLRGVMGIAPYPGDPGEAFARLANVASGLREDFPEATCISAGMSGDLEIAVAHGATQVRVGGAILGQRTRVQ